MNNRAEDILRESNTIITGDHFVYISGDHGSGWVNKDALLPYTAKVSELAQLLAQACENLGAEIVCGPAIGGLVMSQWVAHFLQLPSVFTEHGLDKSQPGLQPPFVLKRGFDELIEGKKVLVVDDIVNTGLSIRQTVAAIERCGGEVIAGAAYCSRGNVDAAVMNPQKFCLSRGIQNSGMAGGYLRALQIISSSQHKVRTRRRF
ncbi:MAG: phosphoribosyltransferase family protein [Candidatus Melainabacteria bacterium]|nr:phosphoribosyltransferase family protein [Candidatus Melainabacteria bacterium]